MPISRNFTPYVPYDTGLVQYIYCTGFFSRNSGSLHVSGKLPTYLSPKSTLTLTLYFSLRSKRWLRGRVCEQFPRNGTGIMIRNSFFSSLWRFYVITALSYICSCNSVLQVIVWCLYAYSCMHVNLPMTQLNKCSVD